MDNILTKYSTYNKIFRVSQNDEGDSLLELPSSFCIYRLNLSKDLEELKEQAQELYLLGVLNLVNTEEGMNSYIDLALQLEGVIKRLDLYSDEELSLFSEIHLTPSEDPSSTKDNIHFSFRLNIDDVEEVPILFPQFVLILTRYLMMFNHNIFNSNLSLN